MARGEMEHGSDTTPSVKEVASAFHRDIRPSSGVAMLAKNVVWSGRIQERPMAAAVAPPRRRAKQRLPGLRPAVPPSTDSILGQHPIAQWSVLKLTVPRLFDLTDDELYATYEAAGRLPLASLGLGDRDAGKLAKISIFSEEDIFQLLLSLTVDYFFEPPLKGALLKETIERFARLAQTTIRRTPSYVQLADSPILGDDEASPFQRFRIDSFAPPSGELKLLGAKEISRWTSISGRSERDLFDPSDACQSLCLIHAAWTVRPWLFVGAHRLADTPEHHSYVDMVEDLIAHAFSIERDQAIVIKRLRLLGDERPTLVELGTSFGVTRERVRQIEERSRKALRHLWKSNRARRFILAVDEALKASGGSCLVSELSRVVASTLGWADEPNEIGFMSFLASCCHVHVETELGMISMEDHPFWHVQP